MTDPQNVIVNSSLISLITVVYNGEKYLQQTILSVINQTYKNFEYIVIDGGSTDRTQEIIREYDNNIDYWISEPDDGIADAMNKGVSKAKGEYIIFIHADDYLINNQSLEKACQYLDDKHDIYLFGILFGQHLKPVFPRGFNFWLCFKTGVLHQGAITKRSVFDKIGCFDKQFHIAMDYDFFLRAYRRGLKAKKCTHILSVMRDVGISSKQGWQDLAQRFNEEKKVHEKDNAIKFIRAIYWKLYWLYRKLHYISIDSIGARH